MKKVRLSILTTFLMLATCLSGYFAPSDAWAAPNFSLPFPCNQTWEGQTRTDHNPQLSVDFNRTDDLGDPVVASAGGTVTTVRDLGDTSYGKYVVIDHGGGWTTYYAHLNSFAVSVGQSISKGARVGTVGSTGGSTGPHLHFEQRLNGVTQKAVFDGATALYYGSKSYTSKNSCGTASATGTVNTSGTPLTVRSGPGTGYTAVGSLADGTKVTIYCQTRGTSVTGTYGTSDIWDRIGTGQYIADAYVYTGSDGLVAPSCN
ncbi:peptidoglycan DD-metalloendopeptidase family protein [Brevibacillus dissolubilis]|uniref:peptidoglycan DD-metalloendopeptidase family protein n=1 Tax=Brevibacillus dissolubilis TaxID=1844116 RepID=UPI00111796D3|nr:peptidoglycan DD-metalloendopeptidase family protein [Brevibacillus dissolubilis]